MHFCALSFCSEKSKLSFPKSIIETKSCLIYYILNCGHSVCQSCIMGLIKSSFDYAKCSICSSVTTFSSNIKIASLDNPNNKKLIPLINAPLDLPLNAYEIGNEFSQGKIEASLPIETIDLEDRNDTSNLANRSGLHDIFDTDDARFIEIYQKISAVSDQSLLSSVEKAIKVASECKESLQKISEFRSSFNNQINQAKDKVVQSFNYLHALLQLQENNLISQINQRTEKENMKYVKAEKAIVDQRHCLKRLILRSGQVFRPDEQKRFEDELNSTSLRSFKLTLPTHDQIDIRFDKNASKVIKNLLTLNTCEKKIMKVTPESNGSKGPAYNTIAACKQLEKRMVELAHIKNEFNFYVRILDSSPKFRELGVALEKLFQSSKSGPPAINLLKPEETCFAFSNMYRRWCRVKFVGLVGDKIDPKSVSVKNVSKNIPIAVVAHLDYGKEEALPWPNLRTKVAHFFDDDIYPFQLLKCSLGNIKKTEYFNSNSVYHIKTFCADRKLNLFIIKKIGKEHVVDIALADVENVTVGPSLLSEYLIFQNAALPRYSLPPPKPAIIYKYQQQITTPAQFLLSVEAIDSPGLFYINLTHDKEPFLKLKQRLAEYENLPKWLYTFHCPKKNFPCVIHYQNEYFRAIIGEILESDHVRVQLIDSGFIHIISFEDLRVIQDDLFDLPVQALPCSLADVTPIGTNEWGENAKRMLCDLIVQFKPCKGVSFSADAVSVDKEGVTSIVLRRHDKDSALNINAKLVESKFAHSCGDLSRPQNTDDDYLREEKYEYSINRLSMRHSHYAYLTNFVNFNVSAYNVLRDHVKMCQTHNRDKIDSLIEIKILSIESPSCFYIQLALEELKDYYIKLEEQFIYEFKPLFLQNDENMEPFEAGEVCGYTFDTYIMRGIVVRALTVDDSGSKVDKPDRSYLIRNLSDARVHTIERKFMRKLSSQSIFSKDGNCYLKCRLENLEPIKNSNWSQSAIDAFNSEIESINGGFFILIKKTLPKEEPELVDVDLIGKAVYVGDGLSQDPFEFKSLKKFLKENQFAAFLTECEDLIDDENEITKCKESTWSGKLPRSFRTDSCLSLLRENFYKMDMKSLTSSCNYQPANFPRLVRFYADCTEVDSELNIWFRVKENKDNFSIICKFISNKLYKHDKLAPFMGPIKVGRACSVYRPSDKIWFRAEITSSCNNDIVVKCIDTGVVCKPSLEELSSEVFGFQIPCLALNAKLSNFRPFGNTNIEAIRMAMKEAIVGQRCYITCENISCSDKKASLSCVLPDGQDLKYLLLNKDLIEEVYTEEDTIPAPIIQVIDLLEKSVYEIDLDIIKTASYSPVEVSHVLMQNYAFIQFGEDDLNQEVTQAYEVFIVMQERMRENVSNFFFKPNYNIGDHCCVKFSDGLWYRGLVLNVIEENRVFRVLYIDYGNINHVNITLMKDLPNKYIKNYPVLAYLAKVGEVKPSENRVWSQSLFEEVAVLLESSEKKKIAYFKTSQLPLQVEMYEANNGKPGRYIFESLIEEDKLVSKIENHLHESSV